MKIRLKDVGVIKNVEIELGKLTIISGNNNTGKTFLAYVIFGLFELWDDLGNIKDFSKEEIKNFIENRAINYDLSDLKRNAKSYLNKISKNYSKRLHKIFNTSEEFFHNSKVEIVAPDLEVDFSKEIEVSIQVNDNNALQGKKAANSSIVEIAFISNKDDFHIPEFIIEKMLNKVLIQLIFESIKHKVFAITSERTGIHLFQRELDLNKNILVDQLINLGKDKKKFSPIEFLSGSTSRYSIPVRKNIDFVRDIKDLTKNFSFIYKEHKDIAKSIEKILGITYIITNDDIQIKTKQRGGINIPIHLASTSVRALLDLYIYIKYLAKKDDLLIIDEPEINLHPENQIALAKVFTKLTNIGINILITTHSDYIIKEINNLALLNSDFKNKQDFMQRYNYVETDAINPNDLKVYINKDGESIPVEIGKYGLSRTSFDNAIDIINEVSEEILYEMEN